MSQKLKTTDVNIWAYCVVEILESLVWGHIFFMYCMYNVNIRRNPSNVYWASSNHLAL